MINPNAKHKSEAKVTLVTRNDDRSLRCIEFTLVDGTVLEGVLGLEHKTIEVGDVVKIQVGFRITSDRYVVEAFKRAPCPKGNWRMADNMKFNGFGKKGA